MEELIFEDVSSGKLIYDTRDSVIVQFIIMLSSFQEQSKF